MHMSIVFGALVASLALSFDMTSGISLLISC
jgi:hypothetical protein